MNVTFNETDQPDTFIYSKNCGKILKEGSNIQKVKLPQSIALDKSLERATKIIKNMQVKSVQCSLLDSPTSFSCNKKIVLSQRDDSEKEVRTQF